MKAITFNLLAWVMLPIMDGFAKYLSAELPVLQITWARYFFTVVFILPIMFFFYRNQLKWSDKPKLQILRGLILLIANICFFYSISVISLAKALTLAFVAAYIPIQPAIDEDNAPARTANAVPSPSENQTKMITTSANILR